MSCIRIDIYNTQNRYDLILADPPWQQTRGGKKSVRPDSSGMKLDYPVCSLEEIKEHLRQASSLCSENSVLFLWTIDKYLFEAQRIAEELGYKLHARMIWNKVTGIPAAFTVRYGHEYLLYMYKGKLTPVAQDQRGKIHTVFTDQVKKHSQKPQASYNIINALYPNLKKLEMYARQDREDFDVWGNEVPVKGVEYIMPERECICNKCGKQLDIIDINSEFTIHKDLGYGTKYDGETLDLKLCCDCMEEIIDSCRFSPITA